MVDIYSPAAFDDADLHCPRCDWRGRGDDAILIDFYGLLKTKEVRCPDCDTVLGGVQRDDDSIPGRPRP